MAPKAEIRLTPSTTSSFNCNELNEGSIIETGQEDVDFKLYVLNRNNQQIMVGQGQIELGELHDQNVHELTLPLDDQYGQTIATKL
jgi:hypothetical protein